MLGIVGIAIIGALFHNMGQIVAVYFILARNIHIFYQIPIMIFASVFFGGIVGFLVPAFLSISSDNRYVDNTIIKVPQVKKIYISHVIISLVFFIFCMIIVFIKNKIILFASAVSVVVFVQFLVKGSLDALFFPIKRFWMLFLFIGILHSCFTYGRKIAGFAFITYEGANNTIIQWLRIWIWLEISFIFTYFNFHGALFKGLKKIFFRNRCTLYAGILAIELFPFILNMVRVKARRLLKILVRKPSLVINELFLDVTEIVNSKLAR